MRTFNKKDQDFLAILSFCSEFSTMIDALERYEFFYFYVNAIGGLSVESDRKYTDKQTFLSLKEITSRDIRSYSSAHQKDFYDRIKKSESIVLRIANQREILRKKLKDYFQLLHCYLPLEFPDSFFSADGLLGFKDLSLPSTLRALFSPYMTHAFLKKIFDEGIYCNDVVTSPQVVTMVLQHNLWESFDMPNKVIEPMALSLALLKAVSDGDVSHVEKLLMYGARSYDVVNVDRQTILHLAMKHPANLLILLLKYDDTHDFDSKDAHNMTALQVGYAYQNVEAIAVLQEHLGNISAEECEKKALRAIYLHLLQEKQAMADNARLKAEVMKEEEKLRKQSLEEFLQSVDTREAAVLALEKECNARKKNILIQERDFILKRDKALLKAYEAQLMTAMLELNTMFLTKKAELQKAQENFDDVRTRPQREAAQEAVRHERRERARQEELQENDRQERIIKRQKLIDQLLVEKNTLSKEKEEWFCSKGRVAQIMVELGLISTMEMLLRDIAKSDSDKHAMLSDLLSKNVNLEKDNQKLYFFAELVLVFFSHKPSYATIGMPVSPSLGYSSVAFFPPIVPHERTQSVEPGGSYSYVRQRYSVQEDNHSDRSPLLGSFS